MQHLLALVKQNNRKAQEQLYKQFADKMFLTCFRYLKNEDDAADILNSGFYKAFKNIGACGFENEIAFECWLRKIMVNEALMFLRKTKREVKSVEIEQVLFTGFSENHLADEDYLKLIQNLPEGYRTVFNLYAIEGYSHQEIGEMLDIAESTSRSQLSRAREMLQNLIKKEL
jgi:RNA polymerase sigma-70 factor (ECF subfamily)